MAENGLERLLAFDRQVQRDQAQSPVFLHRRDRRFALDCQAQGLTPSPERWLQHIDRAGRLGWEETRATQRSTNQDSLKLDRWRRLTTGFVLVGAILGVITMAGLLYYDGGQRINLTVLLAFAALQCLLAVLTIVQSMINWQPWKPLLRRMNLAPPGSSMKSLYPALMARTAHAGGACFGTASVLTLLLLVVVQDLAFGWSTTLSASAEGYHQLLSAIAWPWHSVWPAALPDLQLVEATRFFRADPETTGDSPALWGQWWPFVTMVWLTYVVLPRLIGLALASAQLSRRANRALTNHPGMVALEYRLETPTVDTGNQHHDASDAPDEHTSTQCQALPDSQVLVVWAGANLAELPDSLTAGYDLKLAAGGQRTLNEDQQTLEQIAELLSRQVKPAVTLVTRAWEPPTGELADFIEQARLAWPDATQLALLPVATDPTQPTSGQQLGQWLRFSERLEDEQVCVSQADVRSPGSRAYELSSEKDTK
jgi:hypothetical protein